MTTKATILKWINKAKAEATLRDEIEEYLTGPWADQLTEELESSGKHWFWWGVGGGLIVGLVVGVAIGYFL